MGVVCRDLEGNVLASATSQLPYVPFPKIAEVLVPEMDPSITLLVFYTVKLFYSNLWVPWRTEHHFKRQAIGCPGYCLIFGNSSEIRRATLCGSQVRGKCVRPP
ncbi:hypothetical protein JHK87_052679 [Glycine soja]|nr:hypothetical protein JHK87_052679 [Glycine soja]